MCNLKSLAVSLALKSCTCGMHFQIFHIENVSKENTPLFLELYNKIGFHAKACHIAFVDWTVTGHLPNL